jgi:Trk-type K+ transport system membrane component
MKGAAEYEKLSKNYGRAMVGMDPQSIIHLLIIFFIVIGNVGYFVTKKSK